MRLLATRSTSIASAAKRLFSPRDLFTFGEQGVWYDPSDFSTLFQDSAGTTPVTAVGQPVGLMLDKRNGLVLGTELVSNGGFATASGWAIGAGWSIANGVASYSGALQANRLAQSRPGQNGKTYKGSLTFTMKNTPHPSARLMLQIGGTGQNIFIESPGNLQSGISYTLSGFGTATSVSAFEVQVGSNLNYQMDFDVDDISIREISGNHATRPTAINRPILQQDASGKYYLAFNGTNSWMSTSAIDFTATDKVTVFAGVRKLSDASAGVLLETSNSTTVNNGTFNIMAPLVTDNLTFSSKGSVESLVTASGYTSPVTLVVSCAGSLSGDVSRIRVNTSQTESTTDQGTGNYGNYPLYLGARAGSSLFFNGRLYGVIIRGSLNTDQQVIASEKWLANKTGVTI